jgi:predicted 3-demethylubiquinone-9 3-methyltransferase (glyoxalase superfamily)
MPSKHQKITTFLTFKTQAEEAAKLYTSLLPDGKITKTTRYGAGAPMPAGTVMTVEFELAGQTYVALNGGEHFTFTDGFSLMVTCETQEEVDRYWTGLLEGGGKEVACGWLTDRFGVSWQITPRILMELIGDSDKAKVDRVMAAMMQMVKLDIAGLKRAAAG